MGNAWRRAAEENRAAAAEITKRIVTYSYESEEKAVATEDAIASHVKECVIRINDSMHNIMDLGFELHKDDLANLARDCMDAANSLEARTSAPDQWERLPMELLKKLILKDSIIVLGTEQVADEAEELHGEFRDAMDGEYAKELPAMRRKLESLVHSLESIRSVVRERERLRDVRMDQINRAADMQQPGEV